MKITKILSAILISAGLLSVQSCLKDQEDLFEQSPAERTQAYLSDIKTILTDAKNGWIMEYYPGSGQSYGGYCYILYFTDTEVEAYCEFDTENSYKSFYKLTTDYGPVLSFDTNNPALHYFATPSSSLYQAMGGDFEFMVKNYSEERIEMLGKRSQNTYTLRPLKKGVKPLDYVTKVAEVAETMRAAQIEGTIGGSAVDGELDLSFRHITINAYVEENAEPETYTTAFMYTPNGIRLYKPIKVAGCTFQELSYLSENNILTNGTFTLKGKLPEDYTNFGEFAGDFVFYYYNESKTLNVKLTPNETGDGYVMSGLNSNYTVNLTYDKGKGRLIWRVQPVGTNGNNTIMLAAWDLNSGGSLTWSTDAGCYIKKNLQTGYFDFEDLGQYEGITTDSWLLWETDANGKSVGQWTGWGNGQIPYINYLKRK